MCIHFSANKLVEFYLRQIFIRCRKIRRTKASTPSCKTAFRIVMFIVDHYPAVACVSICFPELFRTSDMVYSRFLSQAPQMRRQIRSSCLCSVQASCLHIPHTSISRRDPDQPADNNKICRYMRGSYSMLSVFLLLSYHLW